MPIILKIPGLYTPDELESIVSILKDKASQEGFEGISLTSYFAQSKFIHLLKSTKTIIIIKTLDKSLLNFKIFYRNSSKNSRCINSRIINH